MLLGECNWQNARVGEDVLDGLIDRCGQLDGFRTFRKQFALFSKSGFTAALERRAARENVDLYTGAELIRQG